MGFESEAGGAADLCEQGKGVFRPPLFSLNFFFTGAVSGCPGREEKEVWLLGFLWFFSILQNCPPLCLSCGPVFIGKMLHGSQDWSLNFFFLFFCKFDFS